MLLPAAGNLPLERPPELSRICSLRRRPRRKVLLWPLLRLMSLWCWCWCCSSYAYCFLFCYGTDVSRWRDSPYWVQVCCHVSYQPLSPAFKRHTTTLTPDLAVGLKTLLSISPRRSAEFIQNTRFEACFGRNDRTKQVHARDGLFCARFRTKRRHQQGVRQRTPERTRSTPSPPPTNILLVRAFEITDPALVLS